MVYIHSWPEYQSAVEALYEQAPERTRYCVKWKPSEGKLVLKITDDVTCLKYKTHSSIYLNRFEALNYSMMRRMQNVSSSSPGPGSTTAGKVQERLGGEGGGESGSAVREESRSGTPVPGSTGGVGAAANNNVGGVSGGGVKKKKGKKKK